jgi:hypothetical protein
MAKQPPFEAPPITIESRPHGVVPELGPMPSPEGMSAMSNADLSELLRRHGVREPWDNLVAQGARYNNRFMNIPPVGEAAIQERAAALYAPETTAGLRRLTRRTQERYTTAEAINGDPNAILVRVAELDDRTCSGCESLAGFEGTIAEHEAAGLPGQQECGGNCRCQNVRVEGGGASAAGAVVAAAAAVAAVTALTDEGEAEPTEEGEE